MIYDGKKASLLLQEELKTQVANMSHKPILAVISISTHPSIASFIKIKRRFAESIGAEMKEYNFEESIGEDNLIKEIQRIIDAKLCNAIIVQLPLPASYNTKRILDTLPAQLDVDVLGEQAFNLFKENNNPVPPVALAIAHILKDTNTDIKNKKVVIAGYGKLVGESVSIWFNNQNIKTNIIDINTNEETKMKLYKEADVVISGIGKPHHLKPEFFKEGVVIIDAGTSEQAGVLSGDCDPLCSNIASIITPVPGGVGPLTVAYLFRNIVTGIKK